MALFPAPGPASLLRSHVRPITQISRQICSVPPGASHFSLCCSALPPTYPLLFSAAAALSV